MTKYHTEEERREAHRASQKKYEESRKGIPRIRIRDKEKSNAWAHKWREENHEKYRAYQRKWSQEHRIEEAKKRREIRKEIFLLLGNKCVRCGYSEPRALQIDHINGGGNLEKKRYGGYYRKKILNSIKAGSKEYQLLCANCNTIKLYENNETGEMVNLDEGA